MKIAVSGKGGVGKTTFAAFLIRALANEGKKVLAIDKNVRFVMAGSGDMMNGMIRYVAESGIADKFHLHLGWAVHQL